MKLRKLELREVPVMNETWNKTTKKFDSVQASIFSYREALKALLTQTGRAGNLSTEEVIKSVLLYGKLKTALLSGEDSLLLPNEDYEYLRGRMEQFPWAFAHEALTDFITYVRTLPEQEFDVSPKSL